MNLNEVVERSAKGVGKSQYDELSKEDMVGILLRAIARLEGIDL